MNKEQNKYTPQYIKDNHIVVICNSREECKKLTKIWGDEKNWYDSEPFELVWFNNFAHWQDRRDNKYFITEYPSLCKEVIEFSQINFDEMNKKLIGYKAPMNLFNGNINKGDVLKPYDYNDNNNCTWYVTSKQNQHFTIPNEIVTQWEAVFAEEKKTIKVGQKQLDVVIHKDGKCECEGKQFTIANVKEWMSTTHYYCPWEMKIKEWQIGCNTVTSGDLAKILDTHKSLQ